MVNNNMVKCKPIDGMKSTPILYKQKKSNYVSKAGTPGLISGALYLILTSVMLDTG